MSPGLASSAPEVATGHTSGSGEAMDGDETDDDMPDMSRGQEGSFNAPAIPAAEPLAPPTEAAANAEKLPEPAEPANTAAPMPSPAPTMHNDDSSTDDIDGTGPLGSSKG
jgi:hypothetical protein